jgi:hypothetical protein
LECIYWNSPKIAAQLQYLIRDFPKNINRENNLGNREQTGPEQGIKVSVQGMHGCFCI